MLDLSFISSMADDQFQASANWWDNSTRNVRFESGESQSSSSGLTNIENFVVFHDTQNQKQQLQPPDSATSSGDPNLHMMMGLGLSSTQPMDWNQASLLRGEKGGAAESSSYRSMLQENLSSTSTNFQQEITGIGLSQQVQWRSEKLFSAAESSSTSTNDEFKQVNTNRGFSLDQTQSQFSPQYNSSGDNSTMDSSALYGSPSSLLQGLFGPDNNSNQPPQQVSFENRPMNFPYSSSFGLNSNNELMPSNWSKVPQFLRASPPKQLPTNNQLHFTNNAPFWNASEAAAIKDAARPTCSFFSSLQPPFSTPNFDVLSKNVSEVRDSGTAVVKKSGSEREPTSKRPRNETPSALPPFKVRKEKMGDRITALQQLVSPFGKTDTASVLSEAIEYIKFLHEQVTVLSTPYMKSGTPTQHQQGSSSGKSQEGEAPKQDLRSRGLCLVPVSSTFPVTHEPTVDFWTPTFGGTYR